MIKEKINNCLGNARTSETLDQVYAGLLGFYLLISILSILNLTPSDRINFAFIGITLGIVGALIVQSPENGRKISAWWAVAAILFTILLRVVPYLDNSVPIGYDMGFYKYVFEHPYPDTEINTIYPNFFLGIMRYITNHLGIYFVLVPLFVAISSAGAIVIFFAINQIINKNAAIFTTIFYSISLSQYDIFTTGFYKNAIGILLLLFSFVFFNKSSSINGWLIIIGGVLGGIHRPSYLIFGITYLIFTIINFRQYNNNQKLFSLINGIAVILLTLIINIGVINQYLISGVVKLFSSFQNPGTEGGFYISFTEYLQQRSAVIIFAVPGIILYWKKYKPINIAALILFLIIILKLYFFKRFIIFLDIFFIIYAALGFLALIFIENKRFRSILLVCIILISACQILMVAEAVTPGVSQSELNEIKLVDQMVEPNATVVLTDSYYGPWFKGWVNKKIIIPGLSGNDPFTYEQWEQIWYGDENEKIDILNSLDSPFYILIGNRTEGLNLDFSECFEQTSFQNMKLFRFDCY